jgi:hypothetical protein
VRSSDRVPLVGETTFAGAHPVINPIGITLSPKDRLVAAFLKLNQNAAFCIFRREFSGQWFPGDRLQPRPTATALLISIPMQLAAKVTLGLAQFDVAPIELATLNRIFGCGARRIKHVGRRNKFALPLVDQELAHARRQNDSRDRPDHGSARSIGERLRLTSGAAA